MTATPKFATRRNPARRTYGGQIAKISEALGKPPMPWQQLVYDVATEIDDDGNLVYEIVLITVPRQSGKTTLVGPVQLHRVMTNPGIRCFYTAQTGKDARKRFEDLVNLMKGSPLNTIAQYRWSAGDEGISFPNGSALKLFAPTMDAIHGETPPLVTFDEIWKFDELLGDALLEGAVIPAQSTLTGRRQVWMISTAGTALSTFMRKWVDRGRESVTTKGKKWPRVAYFEWGLADGDDPYDPEALERFHPAVGYTVTAAELLELEVSRAEWLRAFCNVWTEALDPLFSVEEWNALGVKPVGKPRRRDIAVTYEIGVDGDCGVVMASWRDDEGRPCNRVLHAAPGTAWMFDLLVTIKRTWSPAVMGADDGGPTRRLTDRLRRELGEDAILTTGGTEFTTACGAWLAAARDNELKHDGTRTFSNAIAHLVLKKVGDVMKFSRQDSTGPIAAACAGAVGIWLYDHRELVPDTLAIAY
jgi:hypothetical protein